MTALQRRAIFRLFLRSSDGAKNVAEFFKRFRLYQIASDSYVGGRWCGMFVGIESDGHTHT